MSPIPGTDHNQSELVALTVNDDGSRVLAKTATAIYYVELPTGNVLRTFRPEGAQTNAALNTHRMYLAPNATFVTTWEEPSFFEKARGITKITARFLDAQTGQVVATAKIDADFSLFGDVAVFSPQARTLLLPGTLRGKVWVQAVSVADGTVRAFELPGANPGLSIMLPVPGRQVFVLCWRGDRFGKHPSRVSVMDLEHGIEKPLASIDLETFSGSYDRRASISPDGRYFMVQAIDTWFEVADLSADTLQLKESAQWVSFDRACFAPDASRVLVQWGSHREQVRMGWPPRSDDRKPVPSTFRLYDVASKKLLAEYTPTVAARALAISGDGSTIVFCRGTNLYSIDFKAAFGVEPLPPIAVPADPVWSSR